MEGYRLNLAIIAMLTMFVMREYMHHVHNQQQNRLIDTLTDKIKARDFTEYKTMTEPIPVYEPVDRTDEEMYNQELQEMKR